MPVLEMNIVNLQHLEVQLEIFEFTKSYTQDSAAFSELMSVYFDVYK